MNSATSSFRLIIIHDSPQEAQRLSSMFHNAGKPCIAQHINAEANLNKLLEEQGWDLIIAHDCSETLSAAVAIRNVRKFELDIPVILLTDGDDEGHYSKVVVSGMKLGACDVALVDDDQHLLLIVNRELENRQQRKLIRTTQRKLKELERRNQKLLDNSRDGIAFIQDGMYLYANDSYAEMLGHSSRDDVEFMPVMDNIDEKQHAYVKQTLKDVMLQKDGEEKKHLIFNALLPDGQTKEINIELLVGEYEEEPCTQFICYAKLENQEIIEAELENIKYTDSLTGLYNRLYLLEELDKTVNHVAKTEEIKSLIFIDVDRFSKKVKRSISIADTDILLKQIASIIKQNYSNEEKITRVSDHSFAIISDNNDPEKLLEKANELCDKFSKKLFEIGHKTLQLTLSIGISLINETIVDSQKLIQHSVQSIDTLRKTQDGNGANFYQKDAEEGQVLASSLQKAVDNNDFTLLFQPILSLRGDNTERYEVLLRMVVDDQELSPTLFLNIAEGLKLSKKIDRWVILESIKNLQHNSKQGKEIQQFINLTTTSLCDDTLLPWLEVALNASNIDSSNIILQAKEIDIIQHLSAVKTFVEKAKTLGIEFSISSFGSASLEPLSTLNHIDAKYIKIDPSFSQSLQENPDNFEPLEELANALHDIEKITTIPHIEKASVLSRLWQMGIHCIQGHYLQPPGNGMDYEFNSEEN